MTVTPAIVTTLADSKEGKGPKERHGRREDEEGPLTEAHETLANLLVGFVGLHVIYLLLFQISAGAVHALSGRSQAVAYGYALSEAMDWQRDLERKVGDARAFYGVIAVSVMAALIIQYLYDSASLA